MLSNKEIMEHSRRALQGKWSLSAALIFVSFVLVAGAQQLPQLGLFMGILIGVPVGLASSAFYLAIWRGEDVTLRLFVDGAKRSLVGLGAKMICLVLVLLGTLFLIIPGIIIGIMVSLYLLILIDDPTAGSWSAVRESYYLMRGNIWRMSCLMGRFTGWILLALCSGGIGFLWVGPYLWVACAGFYDELKKEHAAIERN